MESTVKIIGMILAIVVALTAIYKFFKKSPSELEVKQGDSNVESISTRFVALFKSHGVHRNQIPEFFDHGLDIPSCATDDELFKKLTPEILNDAVKLFGVNKDWLESSSNEIYDIPFFDKHPEEFEAYIVNLLKNTSDEKVIAYVLKADKQPFYREYDVLIVLAETVGFVNGREIYKYHLLGQWVNSYCRSRADFAACCALLYKYKLLVLGRVVELKWLMKLINGIQLLKYNFDGKQGINFPDKGRWSVDEFIEVPDEFLKDMDTEGGQTTSWAIEHWLKLSSKGYMRCFPEDESFHAGVEESFKHKIKESL
jgi:hypothetical protein